MILVEILPLLIVTIVMIIITIVIKELRLCAKLLEATCGVGPPDPNPKTFSNSVVSLVNFGKSYICLNWSSGAVVGVGRSDFIGYTPLKQGPLMICLNSITFAICKTTIITSSHIYV